MIRHRILILSPFPPRLHGAHGGSRSVAELVAHLARRHAVALASLRGPGDAPTDPVLCRRCELVKEVAAPVTGPIRRLPTLLRGMPMWVSANAVEPYRSCVREVVDDWRPDIVQLEYHVMGQYIDAVDGCPAIRVLTEHDPGVPAAREALASAPALLRVPRWADLRAWERFESATLRAVHGVVVFTERDRQALTPFSGTTPIVCIPLGTTPPAQALDPLGAEPPSVVFVGNYIHPPNVDAAVRLATAIFPALLAHWPQARLYLIGDKPPVALRRLDGGPVVVTGLVPSVQPFLDRASVVAAPLRQGGGMRQKVLEALGAGKAVVASPLASEGLAVRDGDQLLLAESDGEFVNAIGRLFTDPELRRALALRARAYACAAEVGWERTGESYEAFYEQLRETRAG